MSKKYYIIIFSVIGFIVLAGAGFAIYKSQQDQFTNFKDPHLTNDELSTINKKISDLEKSVKDKVKSLDKNNKDQKSDLFKMEMELSADYRLRGRLLDAKNITEKAQKLLPDNISPWTELAIIDAERGDYNGAGDAMKKAVEVNAADAQAWRSYFALAQDQLHYSPQQLTDLYKQAIDKTHQNADILTLYAIYLENNNDLVGAVAQFKLAMQKNPAGAAQYQAEIQKIQDKLK